MPRRKMRRRVKEKENEDFLEWLLAIDLVQCENR